MFEVSVAEFFHRVAEPLGLEIFAGAAGLDRPLRSPRVQKPSLAFAGYSAFVHRDRVQILGQTELSYLGTLPPEGQQRAIETLLALRIACVIVTKALPLPPHFVKRCEETDTPLFRTAVPTSDCIRKVLAYLDDLLTPHTKVHGVLVEVDGVGVLLTGSSGVGKSECAMDLILRGHRLVADDVVEIRRRGEDLVGQASELIRNLIEIRGIGILNVAELYGVAATRDHKRLELHIELEEWRSDRNYDRIGLEQNTHDILGVRLRSLTVPVRPGRSMAGIVEVAARNFLLQVRGHHAARDLKERIDAALAARERRRGTDSSRPAKESENTGDLQMAAELSYELDHIEDELE